MVCKSKKKKTPLWNIFLCFRSNVIIKNKICFDVILVQRCFPFNHIIQFSFIVLIPFYPFRLFFFLLQSRRLLFISEAQWLLLIFFLSDNYITVRRPFKYVYNLSCTCQWTALLLMRRPTGHNGLARNPV